LRWFSTCAIARSPLDVSSRSPWRSNFNSPPRSSSIAHSSDVGARVFVAACTFAAITLVSIARLQLAGVAWMTDWLANVRHSTGPGGLNDFAAGVAMDHLLNLQLPLYAITTAGPWQESPR
jgi:hypothetical protein